MEIDGFGDVGSDLAADGAAREERERRREQVRRDLGTVMATGAGRRVVWAVLERTGVFRSAGALELGVLAASEGRRQPGLWLIAELSVACPGSYADMIKENGNG